MLSILRDCFRPKDSASIVSDANSNSGLHRSMNALDLVLLGIGAIVGAGIFVISGEVASQYAGPSVCLSFLLIGVVAICVGLCYAELSTIIPVSGGSYSYTYANFGELPAFLVGYIAVAGNCFIVATVAQSWAAYLAALLGDLNISIDQGYARNIALLAIGLLLYFSMSKATIINTIIVALKMFVLAMFVAIGFFYINYDNLSPFIPENLSYGKFGWSGILNGAPLLFFAFNGFETVASAAQEVKNPQKDLPIGLILSILISTVFYIAVAFVLTGIVNYRELNCPEPIALAISSIGMPWFSILINFGAVCGLSTVLLAQTYGTGRVLFTMSSDGLLPSIFTRCSPHKTPYISTSLVLFIAGVLACWMPLSRLSSMANIAIIMNLTLVCIVVIYMRRKYPALPRVFKAPALYFISPACILLFIYFLQSMRAGICDFLYILLFAVIFYFGYSRRHSLFIKSIHARSNTISHQ